MDVMWALMSHNQRKHVRLIDIVNILEMLVLPASAYLRKCSCSQYTGEIATLLCSFTSGPLCICMFFAWHLKMPLGKRNEILELRSPPRARSNASTSAPAEKFQLLFTYWKKVVVAELLNLSILTLRFFLEQKAEAQKCHNVFGNAKTPFDREKNRLTEEAQACLPSISVLLRYILNYKPNVPHS